VNKRNALAILVVALVGASTVALAARALLAERQTVDDVFIFLRYARTLAEGGGYAFGPGAAPVEGTSSVAWTLLLALGWRLGARGVGAAKALSFGVALMVPATCMWAVRRTLPGRPVVAALPAVALALDADLATWASSGMDTALWTLVCVACVGLVAAKRTRLAALALGGLAWVRPEGPLFALLGLAAIVPWRDRRRALALAALAFAPIAALTLIRLAYFHDVVPNTFWAKMNAADGKDYDGLGYVLSAIGRRPLLLVLLPLAGWRLGGLLPPQRVTLALLLASFVFALAAGGDWMPDRRLLVVALPLGAIAAAFAVARVPGRSALAASVAGAALVAEAALTFDHAIDQTWRDVEWLDQRLATWRPAARPFVDPYPLDWMPTHLMRQIAPYVAPGEVVAHVDVGELPYVMADIGFLDGFGLVDREAGRLAFHPRDPGLRAAAREAFFARAPVGAIVVIDEATGRPFSAAQDAVVADARFEAGWREIARVPTWGAHPCVTYVRRGRAPDSEDIARRRVMAWLGGVPDVTPAP
jgi:hypothetical protein